MSKRINRKHFLIFNNNGVVAVTTPKDWARGNQQCFPDYNFSNSESTPTVDLIEKFLIEEMNFTKITDENVVMCYDYKAI